MFISSSGGFDLFLLLLLRLRATRGYVRLKLP
jgi:hypothetical protein